MTRRPKLSSLLLLLTIPTTLAQGNNAAACSAISAAGVPTYLKGDQKYTEESSNYWNAQLKEFSPACVVRAQNTQHVVAAVNVLNQFPDVRFAVKSGGHSPNPGHASIDQGILLSLYDMKGAELLPDNPDLANVYPGGRWNDVIGPLNEKGKAVVGGRLGVVGVGGYLTGGGLSFLSSQYGMAADSIVGWEVVTANGSVVNVSPESHPDLAVALKGSGNNYGIVTKFTMKAFPVSTVWGGYRIYLGSSPGEAIFTGLHTFLSNPDPDPKAAIIVNSQSVAGVQTYMVFFFYDGATPNPASFGGLYEIPSTIDLCKTQSYAALLKANGLFADGQTLNSYTAFRSRTMPFVSAQPGMYKEIEQTFRNITRSFQQKRLVTASTLAYQPLPPSIGAVSEKAGGNAMGLTGRDGTRFVLEINWVYENSQDHNTITDMGTQLTQWMDAKVLEMTGASINVTAAGGEKVESYLPLFWNDANFNQDVASTYRGFEKFKGLQREMDPTGLWHRRTGGFKYA